MIAPLPSPPKRRNDACFCLDIYSEGRRRILERLIAPSSQQCGLQSPKRREREGNPKSQLFHPLFWAMQLCYFFFCYCVSLRTLVPVLARVGANLVGRSGYAACMPGHGNIATWNRVDRGHRRGREAEREDTDGPTPRLIVRHSTQ